METAGKILDEVKEIAVEVYKDAAQPIVKPIGEILGFLPRTIKMTLSGWEKWLINGEESLRLTAEATREKLKAIPEEKLVEPEPYVTIPVIQQISYCQNSNELRELYANLITASMNTDTKWKVHPSYVDIIKQLNPDEARYVKNLSPTVWVSYPVVDVNVTKNGHSGYNTIITNFTNHNISILERPENISSYIDNLSRLNLIEILAFDQINNDTIYDELERYLILTNRIPQKDGINIEYVKKAFRLTSFGVNFVNLVCM